MVSCVMHVYCSDCKSHSSGWGHATLTQSLALHVACCAGLMTWEASASSEHLKGVDGSAWRGAEAYHFCILAHQQLYAGQVCVFDRPRPHSDHRSR
jgi:WD repeat-containing protein 35